jgi:TetR/AcrR family transcriptional regulator, cholesterol catabolism regulator
VTLTTNDRRRSEILSVAASLFWKKGYESTTLNDIAASCNFQAANLYNYFRSKEQILYEVFKKGISDVINTIELAASLDDTPTEKLRVAIQGHLQGAHLSGEVGGRLLDANMKSLSRPHCKKVIAMRDKYDKILDSILEEGIRTGEFVRLDVTIVRNMIISMCVRTWVWYSPKGKLSLTEIGNTIFCLLIDGIKAKV